jgi:hypothetical protein
MNTTDHEELIKDMISSYCLLSTKLSFVDSVHEWCRKNGLDEPDKNKPLRFILEGDRACTMVINDMLPKEIVEERINALRVRSALVNAANNRADMLDSERKKLAYLILSEYAVTVQTPEDELLADQWVFNEMEKKGFFRE